MPLACLSDRLIINDFLKLILSKEIDQHNKLINKRFLSLNETQSLLPSSNQLG